MRDANRAQLLVELSRAREQTLRLVEHLEPAQWQVPYLNIVNPPLWELGHIAWFQEYWCHRWHPQREPLACLLSEGDAWFDSRSLDHRPRWDLPLPPWVAVREYMSDVLDGTLDRLERAPETPDGLYFFRLALFHEQMHIEALAYTWQTVGVPLGSPLHGRETMPANPERPAGRLPCAGGEWTLGSEAKSAFVFDNEKWAHPVRIEPFDIDARCVSNAQFIEFIRDGGYQNGAWWDAHDFERIKREARQFPIYWRERDGHLERRRFAQWEAIPAHEPVVHVSAIEAQAYCRWAGRALPSEAQWEIAAHQNKRFKWGEQVWEWTRNPFAPFAGFSADPYREYSQPAFGNTRVVRGGSYLTPRPLVHAKFRNFFDPARSDMFIGFRTVSV